MLLNPRAHPSELIDAARFVSADLATGFVARSRRARDRSARISSFYGRYPSRMAVLHRLAGAGIALMRFAAVSEVFDLIGDALVPVDDDGRPRNAAWRAYVEAFEQGLPADVREERWLSAHLADMERAKADGLVDRFERDRLANQGDPSWAALADHMAVTLGSRVHDAEALAGDLALETAIAASFSRTLRVQLGALLALVAGHVRAAVRAVLFGGPWVPAHLPSDRRLVWALVVCTAQLVLLTRVWRLGIRRSARGAETRGSDASLVPSLDQVLDTAQIHPSVHRFFAAMGDFDLTASVRLRHRMTGAVAWLATLLVGQGMYEEHLDEVPARFRLFRRDDGSMHFVREFWCEEAVRVFDSDFVVRQIDGSPAIVEVFQDLGVAARMRTTVTPSGGVAMQVVGLFVRGLALPVGPIEVCFRTEPDADGALVVTGDLRLRAGGFAGFVLHRLLRLPEALGDIRYLARPRAI
jgi:hypothetical protein